MYRRRLSFIVLLLFLLLFVSACGGNSPPSSGTGSTAVNQSAANQSAVNDTANQSTGNSQESKGLLKVHFLDVGQADCILLQLPNGQNMLVDAGNNDDGNRVVSYLRGAGVKRLDYLVGTHPHEDHIGGLDTVIQSFATGKVYLPKVTHTTRTFEDVLEAVKAKKLKITAARSGMGMVNEGSLKMTILAPARDAYDNLNDYSVVIKVSYGQVGFLLTGDAEEQSISDILASGAGSLRADVLKVGHHGSHSSTSKALLNAARPRYAVISVGAGNDYGHPHQETMQLLKDIEVYRTDLNGDIVFSTDGKEIKVTTGKSRDLPKPAGVSPESSGKFYVDSTGRGLIKGNINSRGEKIYHLPGGAYYSRTKPEQWFKSEAEAKAAGFRPSRE